MYTSINFKTKKAFKEAVAAGKRIEVFQPNDMFNKTEQVRAQSFKAPVHVVIEGPHFPEPHRWYAKAIIENGIVTKVT